MIHPRSCQYLNISLILFVFSFFRQFSYKHLALFYNPKRYSRRPKTPEDPLMSKKEKAMKEYAEELHRSTMYMSISEAFDVLSDPQKRAIYDQFGERALKEGLIGDEGFIPPYVYHGDPDTTFRYIPNRPQHTTTLHWQKCLIKLLSLNPGNSLERTIPLPN